MTNEQAKSELMQIYGMLSEEKKKALDMAIKALEYDDAKYHEEHGEVVVDKAVWEDAKRALEQEPTGHWICGLSWKCSECGYEDYGALGTDFCPNCGAKMD